MSKPDTLRRGLDLFPGEKDPRARTLPRRHARGRSGQNASWNACAPHARAPQT